MTVTAAAFGVHADRQTRRDAYQQHTYEPARNRLAARLDVMLAELAGVTGGLHSAPIPADLDPDVERALDTAAEAIDQVRTAVIARTVYRPAVDTRGWDAGLTAVTSHQLRHLALVGGVR